VVAAHSGQGAFARWLLDRGADPNTDGAGYTALHAAVLRGDVDLIKALLERGADANAALKKATPVAYASHDYAFNIAIVGATPFWMAARFGEPGIMKVLAAHGADPRQALPDGTTSLMAAINGSGNLFGATTTDRRERFLTPTELAAFNEADEERVSLATARAAIELGADVRAAAKNGDTALHTAASRGYVEIVRYLLDKGADLNAANQAGDTPLHSAATRGSPVVIRLLAERGARLDAKNKKGLTPLAAVLAQTARGGGANQLAEENRKAAAEALRALGAPE
jgi:ankyrin repeat protein